MQPVNGNSLFQRDLLALVDEPFHNPPKLVGALLEQWHQLPHLSRGECGSEHVADPLPVLALLIRQHVPHDVSLIEFSVQVLRSLNIEPIPQQPIYSKIVPVGLRSERTP